MLAVILSGGLGTRLHPLTLTTPKPMLPIAGIPHLERTVEYLKSYGYTNIIFSTGYLHEQIVSHFGRTTKETMERFGASIHYKEDGIIALGTGGALRNCLDLIDEENILVMNGDILTNIDLDRLREVHEQYKEPITMTVLDMLDTTGFGLTPYDQRNGKIQAFMEKPEKPTSGAINAGIYMIRTDVVSGWIEEGKFSMLETDVFPIFASAGMLQGFINSEDTRRWIDIGTHERYKQAQSFFD